MTVSRFLGPIRNDNAQTGISSRNVPERARSIYVLYSHAISAGSLNICPASPSPAHPYDSSTRQLRLFFSPAQAGHPPVRTAHYDSLGAVHRCLPFDVATKLSYNRDYGAGTRSIGGPTGVLAAVPSDAPSRRPS